MSIFWSRIRRLFLAGALLAAAVSVLESGTVGYLPVASKHNPPAGTAHCTLTGSTVGGALTLTGGGYAPNTNYAAEFQWPNGGPEHCPPTPTAAERSACRRLPGGQARIR